MADREIIHTNGGGGAGMGAMLGVIVGALLVAVAVFAFAGGWFEGGGGAPDISVNLPAPPATTGAAK